MKEPTENPFVMKERKAVAVFRWILLPTIIIASPVLIVVRLALALLEFAVYGVLARLIDKDYPKPLPPFRAHLERILVKAFGTTGLLCNQQFVFSRGKLDPQARVVAINHTSLNDSLVACRGFAGHAVSKASMANFWPLRSIFRLSRSILIKRPGEKLKKSVEELVCSSGT